MIKIKFLNILIIMAAIFYSCDDSTPEIGDSIIPEGDRITASSKTFDVTTNSFLVDSVYARTNTAYLGKYTDPTFGDFTADFMAQFTCTDNFEFPESFGEVTGLKLFLQYSSFYGDSLAAMTLQVDTLNKVIPESSIANFYTSIDPTKFYNQNAAPIATKGYSAGGSSPDTVFVSSSGVKTYNQTIDLPLSLGKYMYSKYAQDPANYKDAEAFIKNVLKGIYVRSTNGNGSVLYINNIDLRLIFNYNIKNSTNTADSLVTSYADFAATKEVIQANRFQNSSKLQELIDNEGDETYIKTPAGILTEVSLPVSEIFSDNTHANDTINSASISFKRYTNTNLNDKYPMGIPQYLLMIRKKELYTFFEQNKLPDNITSYVTSYGSSTATANTYTFANITRLISAIKQDTDRSEGWNKVVLIPVKVTLEKNSITKVTNSLDMESMRLVGGDTPLKMQLLYTSFNK